MSFDSAPPTNEELLGLAPYGACPGATPGACAFAPTSVVWDEARIHRCGRCGHGVTRPAMTETRALYDDRDSQDFQGRDGIVVRTIKKIAFARSARRVAVLVPEGARTAYDFGCGSGAWTEAMDDAAPDVSFTGLDFFDDAPGTMCRVAYQSFDAAARSGRRADLVTCFHVLEHDDDPHALLDRVLGLLKPGGTLIAEVPHADAVGGRVFGRRWDNWYLPYHRTHFTARSLRDLLTAHGLTDIVIEPVCVPSVGRSLARMAGRRNGWPFVLLGAALHPLQWVAEQLTRQPSALRARAVAAG